MPVEPISLKESGLTIWLRPESTAIESGGGEIARWDLEGRPLTVHTDRFFYRRGLSGEVSARPRFIREGTILDPDERSLLLEKVRSLAAETRKGLEKAPSSSNAVASLGERLSAILSMTTDGLRCERERFESVYRPVAILPPDRSLSFLIQITEGCSWKRCLFCDLYHDHRFRAKSEEELECHIRRALDYTGRSILLRNSVFLGCGDLFTLPDPVLLPLVDRALKTLREIRPRVQRLSDLYAFATLASLADRTEADLKQYAQRGFRRLYIGVETGDTELYQVLRKPGSLSTYKKSVDTCRRAGLSVGLIFLVGAGGDRFRSRHREGILRLLSSFDLVDEDRIFLSPLVELKGTDYLRWKGEEKIRSLTPAEMKEEGADLLRMIRGITKARISYYPVDTFVY